ncbi:PilZ domain-containing protein [Rhodopseudomonas sp.]|uniref:PilZ domain-containing protein n=1 Tax=Rhodopseudomonas sp. TaxID=1078 RepID=UPI0039E5552D
MEKRIMPRQRVFKGGLIEFSGGALDCVIRNLSSTGAALEVESPIGVPDQFILVFKADKCSRSCRVIWKAKLRIGVAFCD